MSAKSFHRNASTNFHALHIFGALAMVGLSIYLTFHYFETKYPKGLGAASLCDISSFISCDITTLSPASNIFDVPISVLGMLLGVLLLASYFFRSKEVEGTNHFLLIVNFIGCALLCLYSLSLLHGFCPICAAYYVSSGLALFVYWKTSSLRKPSIKVLACYGLVASVFMGVTYIFVVEKREEMNKGSSRLISLYDELSEVGSPQVATPYFMSKSVHAPVKIVKFSDFQCPACRSLSNSLHKVIKKYRDKVSVQYMFYPLDHNCNPKMTRSMHAFACEAAYLAACFVDNFIKVEGDIFRNQEQLSKKWISGYAKDSGVHDCYTSNETKEKVRQSIAAAEPFDIQATPTMIINGRKIDRLMPLRSLYMLIDKLLERADRL